MSEREKRKSGGRGAEQDPAEPEAEGGDLRQRAILRRSMQRRNASAEGQDLDPALRQKAERSLGTSVGDVRVHSGPDAEAANAEMGSKAFAVGNDVMLGSGVGNTANPILAHEVAHTVQQKGAAPGVATKLERDASDSPHEADADQAAHRMMFGVPARVAQIGAPRIQCFDSYEHMNIGDAGGGGQMVTLECGVELTYGEVVALSGDFYGSPEKLMKADKAEVLTLRAQIRKQGKQASQNPDGKPNKEQGAQNEEVFEETTKGREEEQFDKNGNKEGTKGALNGQEDKSYSSLAKENKDHFSPRNMEAQYAPQHEKAIALAAQAREAKGDEKMKLLNEAHLHDGFASHFLTDAFASGHLVSGDKGREIGEAFYKTHQPAIFEALCAAASEDQHVDFEEAAQEVAAIMGLAKSECGSLCLKLVHDMLNENGLEVQNKRGDTWLTKGDDNLASSPRTQELAAEAVRLSREEIDLAAKTGQSPAPRAIKLVPELIGYKGQAYPIHEFTQNPLIFERYLRPLLLEKSKTNPLYQLIKGNLGFAKVAAGEGAEKYGRRALAEGQKTKAGENQAYESLARDVGKGLKAAGAGVANFLKGDEKVAGEQSELDHDMLDKGIMKSPKFHK